MINEELDPENFSLSTPFTINTQYNTRIKISPTLNTNLYFGSWFNYNRIDLSTYSEIVVPLNGATRLSQIIDKINEVADFTVVIGNANSSVEAKLSITDIVDYDLPPLGTNDQRSISLISASESYLFTGSTDIIIHG